jgi:hypothetical protein
MGYLKETTFGELLSAGKLPSGSPFTLMPDTMDVALRVGEVTDSQKWRKKVKEVYEVTASVGDIEIKRTSREGEAFIQSLPDVDVAFLGLAWAAATNGYTIDVPPTPCPACGHNFTKIDLADLGVWAKDENADHSARYYEVDDVEIKELPEGFNDAHAVVLSSPSWLAARSKIPENVWERHDIVKMYRCIAATHIIRGPNGAPVKMPSHTWRKGRVVVMRPIVQGMSDCIPHFSEVLDIECDDCKTVLTVPFADAAD